MTVLPDLPDLKAKHRAMWALGDYPSVATDVIAELGEALVSATEITARDTVLDIAAGSGNASLPAARTGARVIASDLTPELLEAGRREAAAQQLELTWQVADAEDLPFADGEFDAAISCVGIMFAPFHERAADELVRVVRPRGRIGLIAWTPEGFIGEMFAVMKPFAPPPPAGATPPPRWGDEAHVRELLGDRVHDVRVSRHQLVVDAFATPEGYRDFFKERYGPTIAVYTAIAGDPARVAELDEALAELGRRHHRPDATMQWEYLLVTARRT
ncbi:class I SAM-dependent methyltransferase [Nocardioides jensenii]|uniref:class I SAM-dependent methyltransferase n=1 Tax=Nocardioides jensenii TaxID=1843 RepID=UPI000B31D3DB|nr:class I SAM-dependent methyltransferase [Nocardioides jensenii]